MSTNLEIIADALRDINVISEVETPSAEQGAKALRRLNQLMELWKTQDIDLGYFSQTSTTDTCPIPDWAELAVTSALAVLCAPGFSAEIPRDVAAIADSSIRAVQTRLIADALEGADMSHMPQGTGHYGSRYDIQSDQ